MRKPWTPAPVLVVDALVIALVHGLACVAVRLAGFDHISDDDFSRVTIAQAFAHAPKLDPSGTSWLPFPFWTMGAALAVFGRSLAVARATAIVFASMAAALPYVALRWSDVPRGRALLAILFAFGTPWALWSGATTVPESMTASFTAAGLIGLSNATTPRAVVGFSLALVFACWSRYEAWPAAATAALALGARARFLPKQRPVLIAGALLCVFAPLAWMAWNALAHDGPLHFFRRVSVYKRAIGAGTTDTLGAVLEYPLLLVTTRPEVAIPSLFLLATSIRDQAIRARWALPLLAIGAELVFLSYGNARDGAPAHHPERALLPAFVTLGLFVVDAGLVRLRVVAGLTAKLGAASVAIAWVISSVRGRAMPGDDRTAQIARGEALRATDAKRITVTPCAYEHFALIAAYGAPERALIQPASGAATSPDCPKIETSP